MSMTKEEIIQKYEEAVVASGLAAAAGNEEAVKSYELFKAGLDALRPITRDQVEKAWRGEWKAAVDMGIAKIYECSVCHTRKADYSSFCPNCGSPMTDKAVETIMKRMEEMRND